MRSVEHAVGPYEIRYPGWGFEGGRAYLFIDQDEKAAVVADLPSNPGTSVTNAVEQVYSRVRRLVPPTMPRFDFYTVSIDPVVDTGTFKVDVSPRGVEWTPVYDLAKAPRIVATARDWWIRNQAA
jgi:hypothetical protein